jgi:hypothetical protein
MITLEQIGHNKSALTLVCFMKDIQTSSVEGEGGISREV